MEWALYTDVFAILTLFACALNHQVPTYVSWLANLNAYAFDAFNYNFMLFICLASFHMYLKR